MDYTDWNRSLLHSHLLIVIAGMSLVSGRSIRDRILATGILVQGIALTFIAGDSYLAASAGETAAVALVVVFCLWVVWMKPGTWNWRTPTPAASCPIANAAPAVTVDVTLPAESPATATEETP